MGKRISILFFLLLLPAPAFPRSGELDSHGCHRDRTQGGYHCHKGPLAGKAYPSKATKKSG